MPCPTIVQLNCKCCSQDSGLSYCAIHLSHRCTCNAITNVQPQAQFPNLLDRGWWRMNSQPQWPVFSVERNQQHWGCCKQNWWVESSSNVKKYLALLQLWSYFCIPRVYDNFAFSKLIMASKNMPTSDTHKKGLMGQKTPAEIPWGLAGNLAGMWSCASQVFISFHLFVFMSLSHFSLIIFTHFFSCTHFLISLCDVLILFLSLQSRTLFLCLSSSCPDFNTFCWSWR